MLPISKVNQPVFSKTLNSNYMTNLPVINNLLEEHQQLLKKEPLKNTLIVYVHHALQTSINVINSLILLGAKPANIFILGKSYSENKKVVQHMKAMGVSYIDSSPQTGYGEYKASFKFDINRLWNATKYSLNHTVSDILVLDHGGHALSSIPESIKNNYKIIGIEKTTAGTMMFNKNNKPAVPIINVAGSAAKRWLESPLIARAIASKVEKIIENISQEKICAVIGFGAIGQSVAKILEQKGKKVLIYDKKNISYNADSLENVIEQSDYIFGCTGTDITSGTVQSIIKSKSKKIFLSCSSEDKEFLSLLKKITINKPFFQDELFKDIEFNTSNGGKIILVKGGFPVNFDDSGESVPANEIQLTRALIIGGVIDAIKMKNLKYSVENNLFKLSSQIQKTIVTYWAKDRFFDNDVFLMLNNPEEITKESLGVNPRRSITSDALFELEYSECAA